MFLNTKAIPKGSKRPMQHGGSVNRTITYRTCITGLHLLNTPFLSPDLLDASLASPPVTLSDFHFVGVSGPLQSVRRPQDMIYYLKAVTNSFCIFCEFILSWELWKIYTLYNWGTTFGTHLYLFCCGFLWIECLARFLLEPTTTFHLLVSFVGAKI